MCIYICVCVYIYIYIYGERFIIRNLLTWVWGLLKSAACGAGDTGRADVQVQRPSVRKSQYCWWNLKPISWRILSNSRENWSFCSNLTCNWLDKAILHYGEPSASLKVLWFQCQSQAKTLSQIPWDNTWPPIWVPHGLVKFTHMIYHHKVYAFIHLTKFYEGLFRWFLNTWTFTINHPSFTHDRDIFYHTTLPSKGETELFFNLKFFNYLFIFWLYHGACGIFVPPPGIEPAPPTVEAQSFNHWTTRESPRAFSKHSDWRLPLSARVGVSSKMFPRSHPVCFWPTDVKSLSFPTFCSSEMIQYPDCHCPQQALLTGCFTSAPPASNVGGQGALLSNYPCPTSQPIFSLILVMN